MKLKKFLITVLFVPIVNFAQDSIQQNTRPKVGVVLSGGGAKGYAHIGALKKIEEAGIKIDYIGGTSMGAIVGGLYAAGYSPNELEIIIKELDLTSLIINEKTRQDIPYFEKANSEKYILDLPFNNFKLTIPQAVSSGQGPLDLLTYLFRHVHHIKDFSQLPTPFVCIATNIETGEEIILKEGFLPLAVLASGAYPSMIKPVKIKDKLLIDGGVLNNFPVKEVKDMGADIIIGVDLQDPLKKQDELSSATDILQQIIKFNMESKSDEQRKLVDLMIQPDTEGFNVASFADIKPILERGITAAELKFDQLKQIAALQGNQPNDRKSLDLKEYILIRDVKVNGAEKYNLNYLEGKLKIKSPQLASFKEIQEGINRLYSSGNFSKVDYKLIQEKENEFMLELTVTENPIKQKIRFGLHYDDFFKTGLLINYTSKNTVFKNSTLSTDFVIGDYMRYNINYYIDNGYLPSFGIRSRMHRFNKEVNLSETRSPEYPNLNELNYTFNDFVNQVYLQSTLKERYAIGIGLEHQYIELYTRNVIETDNFPFAVNDKGNYFKAYAYIGADSRNNPNFASRGLMFASSIKYIFDSNVKDFEKIYEFEADLEKNFHINNFLSYRFTANFGTFFNGNNTNAQKFIVGGYVQQRFLNYTKFYGLPFATALGNNKLVLGSEIQFKILKNHYAGVLMNLANVEDRFEHLQLTKFKYSGYGIKYGYDSPLGPINFIWAYSPHTEKGLFNLSLGYWF
ncbi:MAG: patatin-like phospholipase family protein [Weeksellaceae bacterium]|nr:patatin-like phospholipase family protein [Weeksellaceae bacterium]